VDVHFLFSIACTYFLTFTDFVNFGHYYIMKCILFSLEFGFLYYPISVSLVHLICPYHWTDVEIVFVSVLSV
jgi:hypothetical protein